MSTNDYGQIDPTLKRSEFYERAKQRQGRSELTAVEVLQAVEAQEQQKAQEARRAGYAVGHDLESGLRQVDNGAEQHTPEPSEPFDKPWINFTRLLDEAKSLELPIPKRKNGTTDTGQLEQDIAMAKNGGELPAGEYTASEKQQELYKAQRIVVEDIPQPEPEVVPMNLREMQATQPWNAPYSRDFLSSADFGETHRWLMHDLMHVTKAVGILASIAEWADHGSIRTERVGQAEFEGRISDLVMCALHMANNAPKGYQKFDLLDAVVSRVDRVNNADWKAIVREQNE